MQKLFFDPPTRYSEDIDLVQVRQEPIGDAIGAIRKLLDPWLGEPRRERKQSRVTLFYRFESEMPPIQRMRLKIEVNTGEHFTVLKPKRHQLRCESDWFSGHAEILTYEIEELLGTKMRALYQRKKGRDLYDLSMALNHFKDLDLAKTIHCFQKYMEHGKTPVSRAQFEANLAGKLKDPAFKGDVQALLEGIRKNREKASPALGDVKLPEFRVYFALSGKRLIVLLVGGDKKTQSRDIRQAIGLNRSMDRVVSDSDQRSKNQVNLSS